MENPIEEKEPPLNNENGKVKSGDEMLNSDKRYITEVNGQPLLTEETMNVLLNDLEQKEQTIADLQEQVKQLHQQLHIQTDSMNSLRLHCVDIISKKDDEIKRLKSLPVNTHPSMQLSFDEKSLLEAKSKLELDVAMLTKENESLKKKNQRLAELIIQRDAFIASQRKIIDSTSSTAGQIESLKIEKEELQRSLHTLKESSIHHSSEMQRMEATLLALRQELDRCRQEHKLTEKEYYRVESALRKTNDLVIEQQQKLAEATERLNSLAILSDDQKREIRLLEGTVEELKNKLDHLRIDFDSLQVQKNHLERLLQSNADKYELLLSEYNEMKQNYKDLFIRYMDIKSDNDRLQRQCENLASDAELARASVYTYKGHVQENEKTFDELLKENLYLSGMLKQKEAQMKEAEERWRKQFSDALRKATSEFDDESDTIQPDVIPKVVATEASNQRGGYSYPLPTHHPFNTDRVPSPPETPMRSTEPSKLQYPSTARSDSTLPTQTLSTLSTSSTLSRNTSGSFDTVLGNLMQQINELSKIAESFESQDYNVYYIKRNNKQ